MRRLPGQAARACARLLHWLATLALLLAIVAAVLLIGVGWRLSQGPVDLAWFTGRLEAAANDGPTKLSIGATALAWEGFRFGVDRPLELRLTDVRLTDANGLRRVDIPRAEVSLSLGALLLGRMQPRAVELDNPQLTIRRARDGTISLDLGSMVEHPDSAEPAPEVAGDPLQGVLAALAQPPISDRKPAIGWLSQIRRVHVHDAVLTLIDRGSGAVFRVPKADIDLMRRPEGGVDGSLDLTLVLGSQQARVVAVAVMSAGATETDVTAHITPINPAALAIQASALAPLSALDAAVGTEASMALGPDLVPRSVRVTLRAGSGTVHVGAGAVPLARATVVASASSEGLRVDQSTMTLRGHGNGPLTTLTGSGEVHRNGDRVDGSVSFEVDHVEFADLPALWPRLVGGGARSWVLENITAGTAQNGHMELGLSAEADLSRLTVTSATGSLDGSGLSVTWLRPVPPLDQARAQLRIVDPDTLDIRVQSARQEVRGSRSGLTVPSGFVRITGLMQADQEAEIHAETTGSLPDVVALLSEQRLHLLERHPLPFKAAAGDVTATVSVRLPLDSRVTMDDVAINATTQVLNAHLGGIGGTRELDQGSFSLTTSNDGLAAKGHGRVAGVPANFDVVMDFLAGPPTQVLQRIGVSGTADAAQLAALGFDATDVLTGPVDLRAVLTEQRNGTGNVQLNAGLIGATLTVAPLGWQKAAATSAEASAQIRLLNDRLSGIDDISVKGDGISVQAAAECSDGQITRLALNRVTLGRSDLHGIVRFPGGENGAPIAIDVSGPMLDLEPRFAKRATERRRPVQETQRGLPWNLDARFDRMVMADGHSLAPVTVAAQDDGQMFSRLSVKGLTQEHAPFELGIAPEEGRRRLTATASNAGDLLRALGVLDTIQGGTMAITGSFDDNRSDHPLVGDAKLDNFRVVRAAGLGKVLQAMTLYGLVDVLKGPGLGFTKLLAPFRLSREMLELTDVRAFSPSLGLTAKGQIDMAEDSIDMQGTIVPAYFFNSLLGNVPLVGRLFSPERGGGVFAASYSVSGRLSDPKVTVNPLAAVTPGFLRGLFGIF